MGGGGPSQDVATTKEKTSGIVDSSGNTISSGTTSGTGTTSQYGTTAGGQTVNVPEWLKQFVGASTGVAGTSLGTAADLASGWQISPESLKTLQDTAGGQYLYGGPQQQAFIDAAVRGASPGIFSQFGAAGGGGGGLQKAALDQSAIDAYARLYQGERANQLDAAKTLPGITQMPFEMQSQLAQLAAGLPGQFSPFLGTNTFGSSLGGGATSQFGQTSGTDATTSHVMNTGNNVTTQITPLHQTPWWETALGAVGAGAGLLGSLNPLSAAGTAAKAIPLIGGLTGAFRN
jgi:hypothetical protein